MLLLILGCHWWPPTETDATGMMGWIRTPDNRPIAGLEVVTLETSVKTDAEGAFSIQYKRPDTHVSFDRDGVWYRRSYRPADEGQQVEVLLPPTQSLSVECGTLDCNVQLRWDLGDGLSARIRQRCESGEHPVIPSAPNGVPEVVCRDRKTGEELPLRTHLRTGVLQLSSGGRELGVELVADGASRCEVAVGSERRSVPPGATEAWLVDGAARVQAWCDGRAAAPVMVGADEVAGVVVWDARGPEVQPPAGIELSNLTLRGPSVPTGELTVTAMEDGSFRLPPLDPGDYTVILHDGTVGEIPVERPEPTSVLRGRSLSAGNWLGGIRVEREVADGVWGATGMEGR